MRTLTSWDRLAVQAKYSLLVLSLDSDRSHAWLIDCRPDRPSVAGVSLVGLNERANELGMQ